MMARLLLVVVAGALSILLFRWASGGLSLLKLNIVSVSFYLYFILVYVGTGLIYLGLADDYYMVWRLSPNSIEHGFWLIAASGIVLPLVIGTVERIFGARVPLKEQYDAYQTSSTIIEMDERRMLTIVTLLLVVCVLATVYTFYSIGSIPFLEVIFGGNEDAVAMRAEAKAGFGGLVQIRNLGMLQLAPVVSLLCQICYRTMPSRRWKGLFRFSLLLTCIVLTYNLEKAPIVFYLFEALVLEMLMGRRLTRGQMIASVAFLVGVLIVMYFFVAGSDTLVFSLTAGPIGRALLAYPAAFMLHIQAFPDLISFLGGAGLPSFVEQLLNAETEMGRSAVAVMTMYNTQQSTVGLAYAMNTFFPAEAYANWGYSGYAFSLIWVGSFLGFAHSIFLRSEKNQFNLFIYIILLRFQVQVILGGFIDYLYSVNLIFALAAIVFVGLVCRRKRTVDVGTGNESTKKNQSIPHLECTNRG